LRAEASELPSLVIGEPMETEAEILQRWRYLREMLLQQLSMFETGALSLRSSDRDVAPLRIDELKRQISEFDRLIADAVRKSGRLPIAT
jgi:hypothetical protein